jgi:hypothetical protein
MPVLDRDGIDILMPNDSAWWKRYRPTLDKCVLERFKTCTHNKKVSGGEHEKCMYTLHVAYSKLGLRSISIYRPYLFFMIKY